MGAVTDCLRDLIAKQVDAHGLVVWFDPEGNYLKLADALALESATTVGYQGSFLLARREIEPLLQGQDPPRLVVYVPLAEARTNGALAEATAAGVTIYPGANPVARNTRLSVLARRALKDVIGESATSAIEKQVEAGQLTLDDLDRLVEQGAGFATGTISLVFGSTNPSDVALAFLASDHFDATLLEKEAVPEIAALFQSAFGLSSGSETVPARLRDRFARDVLLADLVAALSGEPTGALAAFLATIGTIQPTAARDASAALARSWRARHDLRDSYVPRAERIQRELSLESAVSSVESIVAVETFPIIEEALQQAVETDLLQSSSESLALLAQKKQASFWSDVRPDIQARWALIAAAGQTILRAERVASELKAAPGGFRSLVAGYAGGAEPWCLLDTCQRHLERRLAAFDFDVGHRHDTLRQLVARARQRFASVGSDLAEVFTARFSESHFQAEGVPRQREAFSTRVKPLLANGKVAYVLVDAFRFEMAREFVQGLGDSFSSEIWPCLGAVPGITEIGMAALMPGAEGEFALVSVNGGKLAAAIDGHVLSSRRERIEYLKSQVSGSTFETKLEDVLTLKKAVRAGIEGADLLLVTSQEIDSLCEGDHPSLARRVMDDVLRDLRRALQVLVGLGIETFVVAADHGYLFGEEMEGDLKIDPPGGKTVALHRRVWVGKGGTADPAYLRVSASDLGWEGDLEIAVPRGFACFKVAGGARAYFHGGLAPQELVVPVAVVRAKRRPGGAAGSDFSWQLRPGSKRISTRFSSIQVSGTVVSLLDVDAPRVRLEIREKRDVISTPVSASYGFDEATGDVRLKIEQADGIREIEPNTITVMLTGDVRQTTATAVLVDATTGRELARSGPIEVRVSL